MTLSSSMRSNSKRGLGMENHKRGRSFDSRLTVNVKDDHLLLFSDMQMRESENFLLNSSDDFDDSLAKLKHVSNSELRIPFLGEGSDLLNAGSEKNDYDWLLTPPETPLFPSLDDKELQSTLSASRGRSRSQANATSTSSAVGKTQRISRSSASPIRSTPSSPLDSKQSLGRGKPSMARSTSPASVFRSTTPSGRSTTPQNRSHTPTPRSSTPTHRRTSSGSSSSVASFGKATRGNSASPKLRGHWGNFPDFSSEAPSNLRTSISSWSASRTRESSPSSRNGIKVSLKGRRESLSPSASRSVSSSQSNDRDHFSSSCDDDVEFTYPVTLGGSTCRTLKNNENFVGGKNTAILKKPFRTVSSDSAPRGSFNHDRHLHQGKAPHNKFRPLLSSVPPSSFHVTKPDAYHRSLFTWNSSLTTSSNASSDQGASIALDTEPSDHDQTHLAAESDTRIPLPEVQDDTLKVDEADSKRSEKNIGVNKVEHYTHDIGGNSGGEPSPDVECLKKSRVCPKCDAIFQAYEFSDDQLSVCPECIEREKNSSNRMHSPGFQEALMHIPPNQGHQQCVNTSISGSCKGFRMESDNFNGEPLVTEPDSQYFQNAPPLDFNGDEKLEKNRRDDLDYQNTVENFPQFHASGSHQSSIDISPRGDDVPCVLENSGIGEELVNQRRPNRVSTASSSDQPLMENCKNILKRSEYPSVYPSLLVHSEPSLIECADIKKSSDSSVVATVSSMHNESKEMDSLEVHVEEERSATSLATDSHIQLPSQVHGGDLTLEQGGNNLPENLAVHRSGELLSVIEGRTDQVLEKTNTWSDEPVISKGDEQSNERPKIATVPNFEDFSATATSTKEDHILLNTWTSQKGMPSKSHVLHPVKKSGAIKKTLSGLETVSSRSLSNIVGSSRSEKVKLVSRSESNYTDDVNDTSGKSIITIHDPRKGNKSRSLSLEEATDDILFCSSIVYDLAFKAVSMAIEKDNPPSSSSSSSLSSTALAVNPRPTMMHEKSTYEETGLGEKQVKKRISQEVSSDLRPKPPTVESKCSCSVM